MLPPFDDVGHLPAGIHSCSVAELVARFGGGSEERETEINELLQFIEAAKASGVRRLLVNGSFVTGKLAPNDVDVVILPGPDYPRGHPGNPATEAELIGKFKAQVDPVAGISASDELLSVLRDLDALRTVAPMFDILRVLRPAS